MYSVGNRRDAYPILWATKERIQVQLQWILHKLPDLCSKKANALESLELKCNNFRSLVQLKLLLHQHLSLAAFTGELGFRIINFLHLGERHQSICEGVNITNLQAEIKQGLKSV